MSTGFEGMSMTRSRVSLALASLLVCGLLLARPAVSAAADAARPTPVSYLVVCDDPSVREKFMGRIGELVKAQTGYVVRDKLPSAQLILYVNRDADDRVNPKGYSVAIAHVSNAEAYFLASKLLVETPTEDAQMKAVIASMLNEHGMLDHLSVAHMDAATDREIDVLSRSAVAAFFKKTPADAG